MKIKINKNSIAAETIKRLMEVGSKEYDIQWVEEYSNENEILPVINYGISDFSLSKKEQAELFEEVLPNTIIKEENYEVLNDYDVVVMKEPTRVLLWKDAKKERGTKYLYVKEKMEWRVNYAFGKIITILNKNIGTEIFGKSHLSKWSIERDIAFVDCLTKFTNDIAKIVFNTSNDLKSFGLDIMYDLRNQEWYFLELNQANSMNEGTCRDFLDAFMKTQKDYTKLNNLATDLVNLNQEDMKYVYELFMKLKGVN